MSFELFTYIIFFAVLVMLIIDAISINTINGRLDKIENTLTAKPVTPQ